MRRRKSSVSADLFTVCFEMIRLCMVGSVWAVGMFIKVVAWLLPVFCQFAAAAVRGVLAVLRFVGSGVVWFFRQAWAERLEQNAELEARYASFPEDEEDLNLFCRFIVAAVRGGFSVLRFADGITWPIRRHWAKQIEQGAELEERYEAVDESIPEEDGEAFCDQSEELPEAMPIAPMIPVKVEEEAPSPVVEEVEDDGNDWDPLALLPGGGNIDKAITILERRLSVLYDRKDKAEYLNKVDVATWEKYQKTKAWRGLMWEIERTEGILSRIE